MTKFKKSVLILLLALVIFSLFACSKDKSPNKGKLPSPEMNLGALFAGGEGTKDSPYQLSLKKGGAQTVTVQMGDEYSLSAVAEGDAVTVKCEGKTVTISATEVGTATVKLYIQNTSTEKYILVTVTEPDVVPPTDEGEYVLSGDIIESGDGSEASPYIVNMGCPASKTVDVGFNYDGDMSFESSDEAVATASVADKKITFTSLGMGVATIKLTTSRGDLYIKVTVHDYTYAVTGRVLFSDAPLEGVVVCLYSDDFVAYSSSDKDGIFWFTNLENKKYSIKVIFEGEYEGYTMAKDPTYVENSADKIIADYTVVLTKNSTLSGESAKECEAV